jgi:hypothetical protein
MIMNPSDVKVGMEATWNSGSDCYPCTIIAKSKLGKRITIQDAEDKVISGSQHDGSAKYEYKANPAGRIQAATYRKDGVYRLQGYGKGYGIVNIGFYRRYYDPSF